jgi:hypothetical protein
MSTFGPFLGLNNRLPDTALSIYEKGKPKGNFLRHAVNIDLDDSGQAIRRTGSVQVASLASPHSLWSNGSRTLLVEGGFLQEVTGFSPVSLTNLSALASNSRMDHTDINGTIFFSNATDFGCLAPGSSTALPWGMETPAQPVVSTIAGSLDPGWYLIAMTYSNTDGLEGGACEYQQVQLASTGGFSLVLPAGATGADFVNIYLSDAEDGTPKLHSQVAVGTLTTTVTTMAAGYALFDPFLRVQPAGSILANFSGRLLSADGHALTYSEPYRPGLYNPVKGRIEFADTISNVVAATSGVYVVADQTWWLAGPDISVADAVPLLPYGGVPGTRFAIPNTENVGWFGNRGVVIGSGSGEVKAIQEEALAVDTGTDGAVLVREVEGTRSLVVCLSGTITTPALSKAGVLTEDGERLHGI